MIEIAMISASKAGGKSAVRPGGAGKQRKPAPRRSAGKRLPSPAACEKLITEGEGRGMTGRDEATFDEIRRQVLALDLGAPLAVRRSPRARHIALRIDAARRGVELVLPRGISARNGLAFLAARRHWIAARLAQLPRPVPFVEGAVVPVFGIPHRIRREPDPLAPPVAIVAGEIRVRGAPQHLARRVRDHLARTVRQELACRARPLASRIGRSVARVGVREMRSRWGSCSGSGNLSFCWRLVFAPDSVVDYVVAHEVAHLAEMNHGPRFWQLVRRLMPENAAARAWLKRHRDSLFCYGG
jgi:predicted metal-dependent hydrolase